MVIPNYRVDGYGKQLLVDQIISSPEESYTKKSIVMTNTLRKTQYKYTAFY